MVGENIKDGHKCTGTFLNKRQLKRSKISLLEAFRLPGVNLEMIGNNTIADDETKREWRWFVNMTISVRLSHLCQESVPVVLHIQQLLPGIPHL